MRALVVLLASLVLAPAAHAAVLPPLPPLPLGALEPVLRQDPDGGRTLVALLEDGVGGTYATLPVSDAGFARFSDVLRARGVTLDDKLYGEDLREMGAFVHAWSLGATPYTTLGVYVHSTSQGIVRVPVVLLENVTGTAEVVALVAAAVGDDALPLVAQALPPSVALAAPDSAAAVGMAAIAFQLLAIVPPLAVDLVTFADASTTALDLPAESYPPLAALGADAGLLFLFAAAAPRSFGAGEGAYAADHVERPTVRVWTARRAAAGHEAWSGVYLERAGGSASATGAFDGAKRLEAGVAVRLDGATDHVAGLFVEERLARRWNGTAHEHHVRYVAGASAMGTRVPVAAVDGREARADASDPYAYPEGHEAAWSAGPVVDGAYVPLVGARTTVRHDVHDGTTNLGEPITETETERVTSVGVFAQGAYVPLVGARYFGERRALEDLPLAYALALEGPGDQRVGDAEASLGAFTPDGRYHAIVATRMDDDFAGHLHAYRTMVSLGTYVNGTYQPLAGATYDGEQPLLVWGLRHADDWPQGRTRWQTSAGTYTLGFYRPVVGTRFEPETHAGTRSAQESYQVGVYPLHYDPFIPVAGVDYDGDRTSASFPLYLATTDDGSEGDWDLDVVAYTPGPYAFPLAGARHRNDADDARFGRTTHLEVGAHAGGRFVRLLGITYSGDEGAAPFAVAMASSAAGPDREGRADVAVSAYDPTTGARIPLVAWRHAPTAPDAQGGRESHDAVAVQEEDVAGVSTHLAGPPASVVTARHGTVTVGRYSGGAFDPVVEAGLRSGQPYVALP